MKFWELFLGAFIATILLTPLSIRIAPKIGGLDIPKDNRRMHTKPIPRVGGIAVFIGVTAAVFVFLPHASYISDSCGSADSLLLYLQYRPCQETPLWYTFLPTGKG